MVSLHTSWDAFSFVSVSLVSVRASYSRTQSQVSHTELIGCTHPQHAPWCWALHHPGRLPTSGHTVCSFPPQLWLICSLFCPPSFKDPFIFKTQLLLSPPHVDISFSDTHLESYPRICLSLILHFLCSTSGVYRSASKAPGGSPDLGFCWDHSPWHATGIGQLSKSKSPQSPKLSHVPLSSDPIVL